MTKQRIGLVVIALGIVGGTAMAGFKRTNMSLVKIGYEAEGDLGAVRANTSSADDLGCQTQVTADAFTTAYYGYCWATDSTGRKMTCFSLRQRVHVGRDERGVRLPPEEHLTRVRACRASAAACRTCHRRRRAPRA